MSLKEKVRVVPDYPIEGVRFLDITTIFKDAEAFKELVDKMRTELDGKHVDVVVGPEARGFVLGSPLAYSLGVGFVPARIPGKLPAETEHTEYSFGHDVHQLHIHKDAIKPGDKVVIVDDMLATGNTALATCKLVEKLGGEVVAVMFAMEHTIFAGAKNLEGYNVKTMIKF